MDGSWNAAQIHEASAAGLVQGRDGSTFSPDWFFYYFLYRGISIERLDFWSHTASSVIIKNKNLFAAAQGS
ncbi:MULTISPECIES: hypothetical protein [unclassified Paenibacillus]